MCSVKWRNVKCLFTSPSLNSNAVYEFPFLNHPERIGKKCHAVINLLPFIELRVLQSSNSKNYFKLVVFMHFCWSCCYHGCENTFSPFLERCIGILFIVLMAKKWQTRRGKKNNFRLSHKFSSQALRHTNNSLHGKSLIK
jgi:hypothetical protein